MGAVLPDFDEQARNAVRTFWLNREEASKRQRGQAKADQGERAGVTAGKNMDGFCKLISNIVVANGMAASEVQQSSQLLTLPGFFRPTKIWDLLVVNQGRLVAALEFKSHIGPSFGNNFNNRAEEAIGAAHDFQVARRAGAFGADARPFLGWLMLLEDTPKSRAPVRDSSAHFPVASEFQGASYADRYHLLCSKLVQEQLYSAAAVIMSQRTAIETGEFAEMGDNTGLRALASSLGAHVAAQAAK